jgi:hypothetical protein
VRSAVGPAAGFALVLLAGHGVLRLALRRAMPRTAYGIAASVGLSWLAGVAALGAMTTLLGLLGHGTRPLPVLLPVLALLAIAGLLPAGRRVAATRRTTERPVPVGDIVAAAVASLVTLRVALSAAGIPVITNDEYALWMLRARAMSQFGGLDPRVFADAASGYQHLEYPLFLPALFAWSDNLAGHPTDAAGHVAVALMLGAMVAVAGAVLTRIAGPAAAAVALVLVVSLPTLLAPQSLRLVADVPLFAFTFPLAMALLAVLNLPPRAAAGPWLAAAAVLGAGAIGTKAEGTAFAGVSFATALAFGGGRRRGILLAGVAAAAANLPWFAYTRAHHLDSWVANPQTLSGSHLRAVLPWTGHVIVAVVDRWPGGSWPGVVLLAGALVAAALAVRAGHWRSVGYVGAVIAVDTAVLVGQYVITAYGPPSDPLARQLLESQLTVTVSRVSLLPAALTAIAIPLFAGLALRPVAGPGGTAVGSAWSRASRRT